MQRSDSAIAHSNITQAYEGAVFHHDRCTGLPSSICVVDCAVNGFIGDQIILSKGDALGFYK